MIYELVRESAAAELPDEDGDAKIRWAAGAQDGVLIMHTRMDVPTEQVDAVFAAIRGWLADPTTWDAMYEVLRTTRALPVLDSLLDEVRQSGATRQQVRDLGVRLATTASHREPVKYGLALLGLAGAEADAEIARVLAGHDEFTLPGLVALARLVDDPATELWQLARRVRGWGRIHLGHRLARFDRPDIRRWLLVEGWRNSVMDEYLALTAAEAGGLADALADDPDDELLAAACDLVGTLLNVGGPTGNIEHYDDGVRAVTNLVAQLDERASTLAHLTTLYEIEEFEGFPAELRESARRIIDRPRWRALVDAGLASDDNTVFDQADRIAGRLGDDTTELRWRRLVAEPTDDRRWWPVMTRIDDNTVDRVVELAERTLPLADISAAEYRWQVTLSQLVTRLEQFPGRGWRLVEAALGSSFTNNRTMAANTLAAWDRELWPASAREAVAAAADREPEDDLRERLGRLSG